MALDYRPNQVSIIQFVGLHCIVGPKKVISEHSCGRCVVVRRPTDRPWNVDVYKMRFDSSDWFDANSPDPEPVLGKTFLLMCETKGAPKPLPVMRWFFNGRELQPGSRLFFIIVSDVSSVNPLRAAARLTALLHHRK